MIEYKKKTITNKFKIGEYEYDVVVIQQHSELGPKISIQASCDSTRFHVELTELDVIEAHTALDEVMNSLRTLTGVSFGVPISPAVPCQPAVPPYNFRQ